MGFLPTGLGKRKQGLQNTLAAAGLSLDKEAQMRTLSRQYDFCGDIERMNTNNFRPLPSFPGGSIVRVVQLAGNNGARSRLCALGLTPGTEVELVTTGRGPCRMKVRECDLVLGRGMAEKVLAVPASDYRPDMARCDCGCLGPA